jgi:hypothetical protein
MSDMWPLSRIDFERVDYWEEERYNDVGEPVIDGTCLPIEAHILELWGWEEGPSTRVLCPEQDLGGCCVLHSGERRNGCYVKDWYDNLSAEMLDSSDLTIGLTIRQGDNLGDDGFTLVPVNVATWSAGIDKEQT